MRLSVWRTVPTAIGHRLSTIGVASILALAILSASAAMCAGRGCTVTKMGNGLTVVLSEDHAAELAAVDIWVKAGTCRETPEISGVSHMIEHLVFAGSQKRPNGAVDIEMESLGATLNGHTSRDWTHFGGTIASRYLDKAIEVLADSVSSPLFREQEIAKEKLVILDEIAAKSTKPFGVALDILGQDIYGKFPYALPLEGTSSSIRGMTRKTIQDFYTKYYTPSNMAVVVVGDFDSSQVVNSIGKYFQGKQIDVPIPDLESPKPPAAQVRKTVTANIPAPTLAIGYLGPGVADFKEVCATDILLTHLGLGYRSWLSEELVKNKKLASDVTSDFLTQKYPSCMAIFAMVKPGSESDAVAAILARVEALRENGLSPGELGVAQRSLLGDYAFENETYEGRAGSYGFYWTIADPTLADQYVDIVVSVTNDDLKSVAKKYLDPNKAVILSIEPEKEPVK